MDNPFPDNPRDAGLDALSGQQLQDAGCALDRNLGRLEWYVDSLRAVVRSVVRNAGVGDQVLLAEVAALQGLHAAALLIAVAVLLV